MFHTLEMYEEHIIPICDYNVDIHILITYLCALHSIVRKVVGIIDHNKWFGYDLVLYSIGDLPDL